MSLREGSLFSGYNGLGMAVSQVFGSEPAWFSEIEDAPSKILEHHWPTVPNHGDITQIDWAQVEPVDILSGGFPCQDVSLAGKRAGMTADTRSGLWSYFAAGIAALRPRYVAIENVRGLLSAEAHSDVEPCPWCLGDGPGQPPLRALGAVFGDLADLGYDARGCGIRAADVGAPHGRFRFFILAWDAAVRGWDGARPAFGSGEPARPAGRSGVPVADTASRGADAAQQRRSGEGAIAGGHPVAHAAGSERRGPESEDLGARPEPASEPGERPGAAAHAASNGWHEGRPEGRPESAGEFGRSDAAERGTGATAWGQYGSAVERWERTLGRVAPAPTEPNSKGSQRLNPAFVEWMMGLPAGHVTDVPGVNRNAQLKALGNGVVPQQAIAALHHMHIDHLATLQASA